MKEPSPEQRRVERRANSSHYLADQARMVLAYGTGEKWETAEGLEGLGDNLRKLSAIHEESIKLIRELWRMYVVTCLANGLTVVPIPGLHDPACTFCRGSGYVIVERLPEKDRVVAVQCRCRPNKETEAH